MSHEGAGDDDQGLRRNSTAKGLALALATLVKVTTTLNLIMVQVSRFFVFPHRYMMALIA